MRPCLLKTRTRCPLSPAQLEKNRQRARTYYVRHKAVVLAKLKTRYLQKREIIQAKRRALYQRKTASSLPVTVNRLALRYILN
ncbi:hypothetical protein SPRG_15293 [Saprolegnia parasitica CBS 223.65]|uniref:Uncharacterized protein n=1 Tax=Saprolegnia parasitica (strain CBS 223.65) TaxID=695850 RepID=A0A067BY23_SAPPC|nr:hypothetical protein SPRG_15293 [Saprolegnia parasitica CBS 223.65]KDO19487.1 hypothetical protein SPRG_15293 [Saprolegnia parasitica CBS 223.65]|eukprot:XP_012209791.1 hypothetical protein SPRG_15293 [Saprolegnia parasitica CBS 223.65]